MPVLNLTNLTTQVIDISDIKKTFPAIVLGASATKAVTLKSDELEAAKVVVDALVTASKVSYTVTEDSAPGRDAIEVYKRTVTVTEAALTNATNGGTQAINIGAALPANARILGYDLRSLTPFTGGGATAVTCDIGSSGDPDAIVAAANVLAAAVDGGPSTCPQGIRPNKTFVTATQLIATFTPDGAHNLAALTAGSVVIDVLFTVLP